MATISALKSLSIGWPVGSHSPVPPLHGIYYLLKATARNIASTRSSAKGTVIGLNDESEPNLSFHSRQDGHIKELMSVSQCSRIEHRLSRTRSDVWYRFDRRAGRGYGLLFSPVNICRLQRSM